VVIHSRADIKRRRANLPRRGKTEPYQRVDDGEWLNRLDRVEVVSLAFVGEVKTRPDNGHAMDTARGDQSVGHEDGERLLDAEAGKDGRVG